MKILAIDIGGSKLLTTVVTATPTSFTLRETEIVHRVLPRDINATRLLTVIDEAVAELGTSDFERIGVTIPGLADRATGIWKYACFSGISNFPIGQELTARWGHGERPVVIENDVNACAWAERRFGGCQQRNDFLWVTVSNGIGGGLVLDGKLFLGHRGGAAEVGHINVVAPESGIASRCGCGQYGCLEAEAAGPAIARRYASLTHNTISASEIAARARAGEAAAQEVIATVAELIGNAASSAANLLNLESIIFGGGVMESFDLFAPSMEKHFRARLFHAANPNITLEKTTLGYHAALAGAAAIASE